MLLNQFLVLLTCIFCIMQADNTVSSKNVAGEKDSLSLTSKLGPCDSLTLKVVILDQHYCEGVQPGTDSLRLTLKLHYNNEGSKPIILYKGAGFILGYSIASNESKLRNGEYEVNILFDVSHYGNKYEIDEMPPSKLFEVLPPQASFEAEEFIAITIPSGSKQVTPYYLSNGSHVLRILVDMWPHLAKTSPSELEKRWQDIGTPCTKSMLSLPIPLGIDKDRVVKQCPRPYIERVA